MANIVLINVYYESSGYGKRLNFPPVGLAYISEYLDQKKIDHDIIDMGLELSQDEVLKQVEKLKPEWIGLSINSLEMVSTHKLVQRIRKALPDAKIIVGGPHVTTNGKNVFNDLPEIDYGIVGEAEESFYEFVSGKKPKEIPGAVYKDAKNVPQENMRRITADIDTIPFPKFKRFQQDAYASDAIPLVSARGCPFKCIFCQCSSLLSKNWRGVSAEYFIEAVKYWYDQGRREIQILDDNFTFDQKRLAKMADLFKKEDFKGLRIILVGGLRISTATRDCLENLRTLGVTYLSYGIEAFDDEVLKFIKKGTTVAQIEERVKISCEMGFQVRLFFIIGFPYQTKEQMRRTYKFCLKYPIYLARFFNLVPYENTELMDWLDNHGKLIHPSEEYMQNYKKYQSIPLFEAEHTMTPEEREQELKNADRLAKVVSERAKFLWDELD